MVAVDPVLLLGDVSFCVAPLTPPAAICQLVLPWLCSRSELVGSPSK
jgi:hypothetical protein